MLKDITIGQYIPANSPLHRMHPALKIILTVFYVTLLFLLHRPVSYMIFTAYTIVLIVISGINTKIILKGIRPMLWILILTAAMNLFMTAGTAIWVIHIWRFSLKITYEGIVQGATMAIRLLFLLTGTSLLTLTTSPLQLTDGIEKILKPLDRFHVPSCEIAMMMTIAIRFIPTLAEETDKIIKAQTARGADFQTGNIIRRAKAILPILVPLFVSSFRRADELAVAMESRCYMGGKGRTRMKETHLTKTDAAATVIFVLCAALVLVFEYFIVI